MEIAYARSARKALGKIPDHKRLTIMKGMENVAKAPFAPDNTIKRLEGVKNGFRKRFGDWRVLYTVDTDVKILEVFEIGTRGDIYR